MNNFRFTSLLAVILVIFFGVSCKKEPLPEIPPNGDISLVIDIEGCFRSNLSSERIDDIESIWVSIENENGIIEGYPKKFEDFSLEEYTIHLTINNLATGNYKLGKLLLMDENGNVTYATPLQDAPFSSRIPKPVPFQFETLKNQDNIIYATALSTRCYTPADFGLSDEEVTFRKEISFVGGTFEGNIHMPNQKSIDEFGARCYSNIKGTVKIMHSEEELDLSPLQSIQEIEILFISLNPHLISIKGLHSLNTVKFLHILNNPILESLEGLSNLREVKNQIYIYENSKINNLNGLENLVTITKSLGIGGNNSLTSLEGLNNLQNCPEIEIEDNINLRSIGDLEKLTTFNSFSVSRNPKLKPFWEIFSPLKEINTLHLSFMEIDNFTNKFPKDFKITGSLILNEISGLESLKDLPVREELQGHLSIRKIFKLGNLEGLENLTTIKGRLLIDFNANLKSLKGLDNLSTIGNIFDIRYNDKLEDLCALNKLFTTNTPYNTDISKNAYNPKINDFLNGKCSK
ncbi:lipase chaperone [Cyclobacterium qasimii]|uniref:Internalin n=2 Tax=Cyclobacterium qasimii TaxID=1350429 RepID=S7V8U7_9BACT|nr:lipase chaperone [Cyclobacterium qasimii]EPR66301.1 internalin [Cyclobacterium qasimii M12-11B]GEO21037.1 hypothetical protein CQA01_15710 [Cyclobacterium qasimii]